MIRLRIKAAENQRQRGIDTWRRACPVKRGDFFKRVSQTPGSPSWPMTPEEMRAKFLDCAGRVQDTGSAQQLASALAGIAQVDDVAALFASHSKSWRKLPHYR